jgi:hypothetical protein
LRLDVAIVLCLLSFRKPDLCWSHVGCVSFWKSKAICAQCLLVHVSHQISIEVTEIVRLFQNYLKAIPTFVAFHTSNVNRPFSLCALNHVRIHHVVQQIRYIFISQVRVGVSYFDSIFLLVLFHEAACFLHQREGIHILLHNWELDEVSESSKAALDLYLRSCGSSLVQLFELVVNLLEHVVELLVIEGRALSHCLCEQVHALVL